MAEKKTPENLRAEESEFETFHMPNYHNERNRLAREAASLPDAELKERAADLGVSLSGTSSKAERVERVQAARDTA